ncbi:TonB-dependent siderophore receptor [Asticcacaulis excentricus]|uniref:TonB-dependent receptor plug n=1 Tax=Asticcacaulis excentricus (strain ATCC 15261 / DSM 4724 / KCTC 12464 / NCIMB 9791 / VKM B-1370 / CB 48) TaxID=573065 RepID=E8RUS4_ASTEC|nr:TonB-dependent receptor [Asticcacaulis excentricus]ADU14124.1 TonB-dependent receptor plug [Asticcacaulis excentricus CB 48]
MNSKHTLLKYYLLSVSALAGLMTVPVQAQDVAATSEEPTEIIITGARDLGGVKQKRSTSSVFGIDKPLVDTPRAVTEISDKLLSRYSIKNVYDFTAVAAGTYTGSYFGVPGSLNIRGTMADNYYNGFQGLSNFANYPTPVDATSSIEIVRGPTSPVYGSGQVGGFMNFIPKTGYGENTKYVSKTGGDVSVTVGSYGEKVLTGNLSLPANWGTNDAGLHLFAKVEDSDSFYTGMHPKSEVAQISFASALGEKWSLETSYQFIHSDGYLKNIGWNRVTQQLIDEGLYISGRPIAKINNGSTPFITAGQFYGTAGGSTLLYTAPAFGVTPTPNNFTKLDPATVKLVKLSPRTTFIDEGVDLNEATTHTLYAGASRELLGGKLKIEGFLNTLDSKNYQSYGFGSQYMSTLSEQRISYLKEFETGPIEWKTVSGVSHRFTHAHVQGSLNDFVISEDRRDLSVGPTPDDRFNNPFVAGYKWATDVTTKIHNMGLFTLADGTWGPVSLTLGGRADEYQVNALNIGTEVGVTRARRKDEKNAYSYNASLAYKFDWATVYTTYARAKSLQIDQGGGLAPALILNDAYLGGSRLREVGAKTSQYGGRLFASIAAYDQDRSYLSTPPSGVQTVVALRTQGLEGELRWLVTESFGLTATLTKQKTKIQPTAGNGFFITVPSCLAGIACTDGYGGYAFSNANLYPQLKGGYYLHATPETSGSLFATYDVRGKWGVTGGVTYASETGGFLPGAIVLPAYTLVRAGAYYISGPYRFDLNVNNLLDEEYFLANSDTDANANVLPGIGRTVSLKVSRTF